MATEHATAASSSSLMGNKGNGVDTACFTLPTPLSRRPHSSMTNSRAETSHVTSPSSSGLGQRQPVDLEDDRAELRPRSSLWGKISSRRCSKLIPPPSRIVPKPQVPPSTQSDGPKSRPPSHMERLLTPPPTQDRSGRRRYEASLRSSPLYTSNASVATPRGRRGVYDGELEPEGRRGEVARVIGAVSTITPLTTGKPTTPLRLLPLVGSIMNIVPEASHESSSSYDEASMEHLHATSSLPPQNATSRPIRTPSEPVPSQRTLPQSRPPSRHVSRLQPPPPSRISSPHLIATSSRASHRFHSDGESTCSDDNIHDMMADFLPSPSNPTAPNRSILHSPSAVFMNQISAEVASQRRHDANQPSRPNALSPLDISSHVTDNDIPRIRSAVSSQADSSMSMLSAISVGSGVSSVVGTSSPGRHLKSNVTSAGTTGIIGTNALQMINSSDVGSGTSMLLPGGSATDASIDVWQTVASASMQRGDYDMALAAFTAVLQAQVQRHGRSPDGKRIPHAAVAAAYHNLGTVHAKRAAAHATTHTGAFDTVVARERAAALECFQAAARCARDATPASAVAPHPNVAVSLVRVGFLLMQGKQYQNAAVTFTEALRIRLAVYGRKHALTANLYNNVGVCCLHMGGFARGLEHLQQALDIQRHLVQECRTGGSSSGTSQNLNQSASSEQDDLLTGHQLELADTFFNIGGLCLEWMRRQGPDSRQSDQAVLAFQECLQIRTMLLGKKDPRTAQAAALWATARALPRPRRLVTTSGSTISTRLSKSSDSSWRRGLRDTMATRPVTKPPQVRRSTQSADSSLGDTFPLSLSPTRSNATNTSHTQQEQAVDVSTSISFLSGEDSHESSIFHVGSTNNHSPLRNTQHIKHNSESTINDQQDGQSTPLLQITISKDDIDYGVDMTESTPGETHPYVTSQRLTSGSTVLSESRHRSRNGVNESVDAVANELSHTRDAFEVDNSVEETMVADEKPSAIKPHFSSSYDAEENCLINDNGVDSEIGRIHYPLAWSRAGIQINAAGQPSPQREDIMVARPTLGTPSTASHSGHPSTRLDAKNFVRADSFTSDKWGSETMNILTWNPARDELLAKAQAMPWAQDLTPEQEDKSLPLRNETKTSVSKSTHREAGDKQELTEDSFAAFGSHWGMITTADEPTPLREMLRDPMKHLSGIHDVAARKLKENNVADAQRLFDVVLECQRHRHGPFHPDVASASHNLGIAQLRASNHAEALKSFEKAARIRKGSLGKEHALVAVSLVKVGITLLLLHRFEEALWSFREALSVRKHALGSLHPSTARVYNNIGCVYVEFKAFQEARRAFEAGLDIQRSALCHDKENFPLMFATATTLCNLGYLYRYRDMHAKAAAVLKEATYLQEIVLGPTHAAVLSTLDNLADSYANSANATDALQYYNTVLGRFKSVGEVDSDGGSKRQYRAEAVLLYKMSRVHRQQKDRGSQLNCLKLALEAIRQYSDPIGNGVQQHADTLERRIHYDIRACREELEKEELQCF